MIQWERFRLCEKRPNAAVQSELNTYITETREVEHLALEEAVTVCQYTEQVHGIFIFRYLMFVLLLWFIEML